MNPAAVNPSNAALLAAGMEQSDPSSRLGDLTTGLARGDDAAWLQFHREYGPGIFRQLLALTHGDHHLATEALQQTYLRIARYARPCESTPIFAGWLRVVARSALHDCYRRRLSFWNLLKRHQSDPSAAISSSREDRTLAALDVALGLLSPEDRLLLETKYFSGTRIQAIAETLNISPKAAESRLTRARAELRRHLLAALPRHD